MGRIVARSDGQVLYVERSPEDAVEFIPPAGALFLACDVATNQETVNAIERQPQRYTIVGSLLRLDGSTTVPINADSQQETDRKALPTLKSQIETYMGLTDLPVPADLADIATGSNAAAIVTYINGTLLPRINQLDTLVTRTNANTNATQGIFRILRYIGIKLGVLS